MRRIEIRLKDDDTPFLNMLFVIEDKDRFVCTNLDGKILVYSKKEYDFRFLDPPEEKPNNLDSINSRQNEIEHKLDSLENENGRLTKRIEALEELCKDGDLYKVKALDINYGDLSCGFNELTKKVEKLELDNKAFKNAFANLGIPVHPACVQKFSYTEEEIEKAIDTALISINMFGVPRLKSSILSVLRKNKEGE